MAGSFTIKSFPVVGPALDSYYQALPNDIPKAMIRSGLVSLMVSPFITQDHKSILILSGLGLATVTIANLVTPIFTYAFADKDRNFGRIARLARNIVSLGTACVLIDSLKGNAKTNCNQNYFNLIGVVQILTILIPNKVSSKVAFSFVD